MQILGSCHCGNIAFSLSWDPDPTEIPARACGCSFCHGHGGVWTSNPAGELRARIKDRSVVSLYEFGTRTARFYVCRTCGVVPFVTSDIDGDVYAVVSVNAFTNVDPSILKRAEVSFDEETEEARLRRRKRGWIRRVQIESGV